MAEGSAIFLDTTIQIARFLREKKMKERIKERISGYHISVSSPVVQMEFKRRVLGDALYLLRVINNEGSYSGARRVVENLPAAHRRKEKICLAMLSEIFEEADDVELTNRAKRYLRTLLKSGIQWFRNSVGHLVSGSACYWANYPILEKKPYQRYEMGGKRCSELNGLCPVVEFLKQKADVCARVLEFLRGIPAQHKTEDLLKAENFLLGLVDNPASGAENDPCLTVGDLIIALESDGIPHFYTMNYRDSQFLCNVLNQTLIVRHNKPEREDSIYSPEDKPWNFGATE